jgi:spore germination protein GerM
MPNTNYIPVTLAEEVFENVKQWYKEKKLPVPTDEYEACQELIRYEKEHLTPFSIESTEESTNEQPTEQSTTEQLKHESQQHVDDPKKQFWKDYWAKKKAAGYVTKKEQALQQQALKKKS